MPADEETIVAALLLDEELATTSQMGCNPYLSFPIMDEGELDGSEETQR